MRLLLTFQVNKKAPEGLVRSVVLAVQQDEVRSALLLLPMLE